MSTYNPHHVDCECQIHLWTMYREDNSGYNINTHFYNHIMELFIPKVCCDIVKGYVGKLPYSQKLTRRISLVQYLTLGYTFVDEGYKMINFRDFDVCVIERCNVQCYKDSSYCGHHYNELSNRPVQSIEQYYK